MTPDHGAVPPGQGPDDVDLSGLTEEELRAAYEAELALIRVEDVLLQTVVSLLNLGARKAGLTGADEEPDFDQVGQAVDATRALLPLLEPALGPDAKQLRDALSHLQVVYARSGKGASPGAEAPPETPAEPGGAGPARSSGRLWVPGQ